MTIQAKKRTKQYADKNPVEAFRDIGVGVVSSVKNDVVTGSIGALWEQFLGGGREERIPGKQFSGDLTPGTELDLTKTRRIEDYVEPGINYHREMRTAEVKIIRENETELQKKIAQIQYELKKLTQTSSELQVAFKEITIERAPVKPGKYHLNFFEWLLSVIKTARMKVDESKSWLTIFYSRRAKRQYWSMFKKHGTTFGLSHERVVATQTG